nr:hypothetical protein CFP56_68435 [Quercus suber]
MFASLPLLAQPLSNFVSSNPSSNRRCTYIQSNSAALLFCHSKLAKSPTIFRLTHTCFNKCVEKRKYSFDILV